MIGVVVLVRLVWLLPAARPARKVRRVQGEMMSAARQEVLEARRDPSADPVVVSRVLRRLDAWSLR
ncbi:hypothetical protein [Nonomuraea sp. KM90]|uniref:hypothetical protein n=1 Tax=Nonomuraea sp. KM90 TaxID=3457428 RepID=UPI003FCE0892